MPKKSIPTPPAAFQPPTSATDPNVAQPPPQPPAPPPEPPEPPRAKAPPALPDAVLLEQDFGCTVNMCVRTWAGGSLITKRAEIAELLQHGAPVRRFREIRDE